MAATLTQVSNYISYIRVGIAEFTNKVTIKERLGHKDLFCNRQKVVLLSAYLDCIVDYFDPFVSSSGSVAYDTNNFFTTDEIRDVMQHVNNLAGTFYMIEL
jgi:hypothetical protein